MTPILRSDLPGTLREGVVVVVVVRIVTFPSTTLFVPKDTVPLFNT